MVGYTLKLNRCSVYKQLVIVRYCYCSEAYTSGYCFTLGAKLYGIKLGGLRSPELRLGHSKSKLAVKGISALQKMIAVIKLGRELSVG